ncbi:hypothetical protein FPQ18DRAFT_324654 [Pyronema domesticum]|nr:hypothetical protein FPQ18DRAFT_324654 [Pyronema domesticum]
MMFVGYVALSIWLLLLFSLFGWKLHPLSSVSVVAFFISCSSVSFFEFVNLNPLAESLVASSVAFSLSLQRVSR